MMRGGMMGGGGGGPRGGGGGGMGGGGFGGFGGTQSRYNVTISVNVQNLLNKTNFSNFNGTLTSPFFGIANNANSARRIEGSIRFNF